MIPVMKGILFALTNNSIMKRTMCSSTFGSGLPALHVSFSKVSFNWPALLFICKNSTSVPSIPLMEKDCTLRGVYSGLPIRIWDRFHPRIWILTCVRFSRFVQKTSFSSKKPNSNSIPGIPRQLRRYRFVTHVDQDEATFEIALAANSNRVCAVEFLRSKSTCTCR
jgi:hypothetical protein